jgi:hypothetical protein
MLHRICSSFCSADAVSAVQGNDSVNSDPDALIQIGFGSISILTNGLDSFGTTDLI